MISQACVAEGRCDCVVNFLRELAGKTSFSYSSSTKLLFYFLDFESGSGHLGTPFCHIE